VRREYDGLTGSEILDLLLIEVREALQKEGRLSMSQVYHNVVLSGDLYVDSYPHEPKVEKFEVKAKVGKVGKTADGHRVAAVTFSAEKAVPDLAREEIENVRRNRPKVADISGVTGGSDADFVTNAEGKG
jgi:hypothetical protein